MSEPVNGHMARMDKTDRRILRLLLSSSRKSKAEIARAVKLTPNAVVERMRKLEERGVIRGYTTRLDPHILGLKLLAFVFVAESKPVKGRKTGPQLAAIPQVEEVHRVAGRDCFLLKVRAKDTDDLARLLDAIGQIASVTAVETTIVLETFVEKTFDAVPS